MKNNYIYLILICLFFQSCETDKSPSTDYHDTIQSHWYVDLRGINPVLYNELKENPDINVSKTDSALLNISNYLEIVIAAVTDESGGLRPEDGLLVNPNDNKTWNRVLEEIEFEENLKSAIHSVPNFPETVGERLIKSVQLRINEAKSNDVGLRSICIELRIIQYNLLTYVLEY